MVVSNRPAQRHKRAMGLATVMIFVMGIANFAAGRAVFESGHPLLARLPQTSRTLGRRAALVTDFAMLVAAMMLSVNGWPGIAYVYAAYTAGNAGAAWLIVTRRI